LPASIVTVVVPTLGADDALAGCLRALETQTFERFDVVVVDNSGMNRVQAGGARVRVIANARNVGFGSAVNQAIRSSDAPYVAALNDDAEADPAWLERLVAAAEARPRAGMFASEVRLAESGMLDSTGMLIAADGSSKQRGHLDAPEMFAQEHDALCPSGSAALYRRKMLDQVGLFDETFFLYCEDTDLGLRARRAGWECGYVAGATVRHRYSHSAGRASPLKAYYVERNRLFTAVKNLPLGMLVKAPFYAATRYFWHVVSMLEGRGKVAEFRQAGYSAALLPFLVFRAHFAALARMPYLISERRRIRGSARIGEGEYRGLLAEYSIGIRQVATL
jgi:GT2 family glycosyltransferase